MGNFKVDPDKLRDSAKHLSGPVASGYANSATAQRTNGKIDMPGFGIALSMVEAAYASRLDFMALDVQGAHDVVTEASVRHSWAHSATRWLPVSLPACSK